MENTPRWAGQSPIGAPRKPHKTGANSGEHFACASRARIGHAFPASRQIQLQTDELRYKLVQVLARRAESPVGFRHLAWPAGLCDDARRPASKRLDGDVDD